MINVLKAFLLLPTLTALLLVIGAALGGTSGLTLALILAAVMNLGAYWFSDKPALAMAGARAVSEVEAPERYQIVTLRPMRNVPAATAPLFIVNPLSPCVLSALFSDHPTTRDRIARLRKMALQEAY